MTERYIVIISRGPQLPQNLYTQDFAGLPLKFVKYINLGRFSAFLSNPGLKYDLAVRYFPLIQQQLLLQVRVLQEIRTQDFRSYAPLGSSSTLFARLHSTERSSRCTAATTAACNRSIIVGLHRVRAARSHWDTEVGKRPKRRVERARVT